MADSNFYIAIDRGATESEKATRFCDQAYRVKYLEKGIYELDISVVDTTDFLKNPHTNSVATFLDNVGDICRMSHLPKGTDIGHQFSNGMKRLHQKRDPQDLTYLNYNLIVDLNDTRSNDLFACIDEDVIVERVSNLKIAKYSFEQFDKINPQNAPLEHRALLTDGQQFVRDVRRHRGLNARYDMMLRGFNEIGKNEKDSDGSLCVWAAGLLGKKGVLKLSHDHRVPMLCKNAANQYVCPNVQYQLTNNEKTSFTAPLRDITAFVNTVNFHTAIESGYPKFGANQMQKLVNGLNTMEMTGAFGKNSSLTNASTRGNTAYSQPHGQRFIRT